MGNPNERVTSRKLQRLCSKYNLRTLFIKGVEALNPHFRNFRAFRQEPLIADIAKTQKAFKRVYTVPNIVNLQT